MTQLDPRSPTTTPPSTPGPGAAPLKAGPPFNWRISVGMAVGLVVLFGVLFGLRALGIFPSRPAEDPEIVAVRATLAALPTQQPAPAAQAIPVPTQPPASATLGPIILAIPAPTNPAPEVATVPPVPATAPAPAVAQQPTISAADASTTGTVFETAPTPVATTASTQAAPVVGTSTSINPSSPEEATPAASTPSSSAQPTPVAVNLPADLANAILQAYTNYWTVRVNAMRDPMDPSIDLGSVMGGNELLGAQKTLAQYRDAGEAFDSDVKHTIWITDASPEEAVVVDRYVGNTTFLDPGTKEPLSAQPLVQSFSDRFLLRNMDGAWKVVQEEPEQ